MFGLLHHSRGAATQMPILVACDVKFPTSGDAQVRSVANQARIGELLAAQDDALEEARTTVARNDYVDAASGGMRWVKPLRWTVVYEDLVDATSGNWRLFKSVGQPQALRDLEPSDFGMVLVEHVWPRSWMSDNDRKEFHMKFLQTLICQWPQSFICMVGRSGGLDDMNRIAKKLTLKSRRVFLLPVWSHYAPRCQDSVNDQLVSGGELSLAFVVGPGKMQSDVAVHLVLKKLADWKTLYVPHLVEIVSHIGVKPSCQLGPHIVQFAAWSLESTEALIRHVACIPDF